MSASDEGLLFYLDLTLVVYFAAFLFYLVSIFLHSYSLGTRISNSLCILFDFLAWQQVSSQRACAVYVGGLVSNALYYIMFYFLFSL